MEYKYTLFVDRKQVLMLSYLRTLDEDNINPHFLDLIKLSTILGWPKDNLKVYFSHNK